MKRLLYLLLAASFITAACNSNKKTEEEKMQDKITDAMKEMDNKEDAVNNVMDKLADSQKETEELKKLPPLSLDQLKAMIPESLMGGKKTRYNATSAMGTGMVNAEYKINDSTDIKVTLWDCGGPAGAGIYSLQYMGLFNMESETETEYTKSIPFNGGRAIENCQKERVDCKLTYFGGGRFLITLEGDNVNAEGLKQAASALNIK